MNLGRLFENSAHNNFILIQDNKEARGGVLVNEFINQNIKTGNSIYFIKLEKNPATLTNFEDNKQLTIHCLNDFQMWLKATSEEIDSKTNVTPMKLLQQVLITLKPGIKNVIIIDSLSHFMLYYPDKCYKVMHQLINLQGPGNHLHQVICLIHNDVLPGGKKVLTIFEQLATTNVVVERIGNKSRVTTNYRKPSGRILQSVEHFYLDKNGTLVTKEVIDTKEKASEKDNTDQMTSDITFKLKLEDEEKRARSELVLPYIRTGKSSGTGEILYELESTDDWDEEDPDDDLDI